MGRRVTKHYHILGKMLINYVLFNTFIKKADIYDSIKELTQLFETQSNTIYSVYLIRKIFIANFLNQIREQIK